MPNIDGAFSSNVEVFCQFIGTLFMNALKMVIVPLIVASIISGVMHLGAEKGVGRMGFKTFLYYTCSGAAAVIVGVVVVNLIGPGNIDAETATAMLGRGSETALNEGLMSKVEGRSSSDLFDIFLRMFPSNIVDAATNNGQLLGVITFSLLFGAFIGKLPETQRETQQKFWESAQEVMLKLTDFIIRFAPFGVFGLVTPVLFNAPIGDLIGAIFWFFVTVVLALVIHFFINLALVLKFIGKVNPITHYKEMAPVLLTAFSTASSSATLPLTIDTVEDARQGLEEDLLLHPATRRDGEYGRHRTLRMRRRALHRPALRLHRPSSRSASAISCSSSSSPSPPVSVSPGIPAASLVAICRHPPRSRPPRRSDRRCLGDGPHPRYVPHLG